MWHDKERLTMILEEWLAIDSTSGQELAMLLHLEQFFQDLGWNTFRQEVAPDRFNLIAHLDEDPGLIYSTHVDTVPPFLAVRREGGRVFGRGACDTKGGLLAMVAAAETLRAAGRTDLGFILVVGEEVDHCGAKKARELDLCPQRIILCEPTQNQVVSAQKGMLKFQLSATGVAGHSAFPGHGRSALPPLLDALQALRDATYPEDDILGPTTLNIGTLHGGVAANVFAPTAEAQLLFRAVSPVAPLLEQIRALLPAEVELSNAVFNDPVFFDPPDGVDTCTVPFNTDATYMRDLGPVWLVGPGDIRLAHGDHESIDLDDLLAGVHLYLELAAHVV